MVSEFSMVYNKVCESVLFNIAKGRYIYLLSHLKEKFCSHVYVKGFVHPHQIVFPVSGPHGQSWTIIMGSQSINNKF